LQVGRSTAGVLALGDWPDRMDMPVRTSPGSITALTIEVLHGGVLVLISCAGICDFIVFI